MGAMIAVGTGEDGHVLDHAEDLMQTLSVFVDIGTADGRHTRTSTFWNMLIPLTASFNAMSCGVDTITAPNSESALDSDFPI